MNIQNKTFIVTGGSSGLGEASAKRLSSLGANVVIADLNAEAGTALADSQPNSLYMVRSTALGLPLQLKYIAPEAAHTL